MQMVHLRAVSPVGLTDRVDQVLSGNPCVFALDVARGAARSPDGDRVECDVLTGAVNEVLGSLRGLGLEEHGSITVELIELAACRLAADTETARLGKLASAPWWADLDARIEAEARFVPSFFLLLVIAGLIAAIGIVSNSQILIVAAMVVGPEYGAITSVAQGLDRRVWRRVRRGLAALFFGFLAAIVASLLFSLLVRGLDQQSKAFTLGLRPVSNLINTPNFLSFVVAFLAGIVGIVSLAEVRTAALLGVFISITTIPAAADVGVSLAFESWSEARGSALQLLLNVVVLILVGAVALRVQRWAWRRIARRSGRATTA
jgi:uncharacterized hydrophobic protein (TIGR00271 family)